MKKGASRTGGLVAAWGAVVIVGAIIIVAPEPRRSRAGAAPEPRRNLLRL